MIDLRDRIPSGYTGRFIIPNLEEVEGIAVHHSVSGWVWNPLTQRYTGQVWNDAVDAPPEAEVAHLLAIDRWHSPPNNDWGGFGYHLAAFASGRVYLCGSLNTARAHVVGLNKQFNGLVLIGDFTKTVPRESHLGAAKEGIAFIRAGHGRTLPVEAHRLIRNQSTTCPGALYYKWVPGLNEGSSQEEKMDDDERVRQIVKELLGYRPDADNEAVREDMAKMRVQALSVLSVIGFALQGGEAWKEARRIMDFYGWGK